MTPDIPSVISAERIERAIQMRYSPFPELTMELLSQQLNQFRIGELRPAARTWEIMMERDGELGPTAEKLFADVARLPWDIEKDEQSAEADAHAEVLRYFYTHLTATSVLEQNERGGLNLLLRQLMTAHAARYSAHEMLLRIDNASKRQVTAQFQHCPVWFLECRKGRLGFLAQDGDVYGMPLEPGRWLAAVGRGLMRPCSVAYGVKHYPLRDWLLYSSRFGLPGVQGLTDAVKGSKEWNDFCTAVQEFANNWITVTNRNAEIKLIEAAKGSSSLPFKDLVERSDRLYARCFRGGDLSTQSREGNTVSGASLQEQESNILLADCAQWATDTLNAGVDEPVIEYAFNAQPKAWFKLIPPKQPNTDRDIKAMDFIVSHGGRVSQQTAHERLQIPQAQEKDELLRPALNDPRAGVPGQPGDEPALGNENTALDAAAQKAVIAAMETQFQGLGERLARISQIQDDQLWLQSWQQLEQELQSITHDLLVDPAAAGPMAQAAMSALLNGLAAAKQERTPNA
jgi:phage gp29-like protein